MWVKDHFAEIADSYLYLWFELKLMNLEFMAFPSPVQKNN